MRRKVLSVERLVRPLGIYKYTDRQAHKQTTLQIITHVIMNSVVNPFIKIIHSNFMISVPILLLDN